MTIIASAALICGCASNKPPPKPPTQPVLNLANQVGGTHERVVIHQSVWLSTFGPSLIVVDPSTLAARSTIPLGKVGQTGPATDMAAVGDRLFVVLEDDAVVQLSINGLKPLDYHVELGARLAPLRDRGIAIVASGNVVHNLRLIDRSQPDAGFDWAQRFDDAAHEQMTHDPGGILRLQEHPDFAAAVPTPDHFIPLLYLAGLAGKAEPAHAVLP